MTPGEKIAVGLGIGAALILSVVGAVEAVRHMNAPSPSPQPGPTPGAVSLVQGHNYELTVSGIPAAMQALVASGAFTQALLQQLGVASTVTNLNTQTPGTVVVDFTYTGATMTFNTAAALPPGFPGQITIRDTTPGA